MKTLLAMSLFIIPSSALSAQLSSRLNSPIPLWADSALARAGVGSTYDLSSSLNPDVAFADLDGDGLADMVVAVVDKIARRRGLAVVHQIDRSVHIIGAGQQLGNGQDQLPSGAGWALGGLLGHRVGIRVVGWHTSAWIVWNGQRYAWVQDSN